VQDRWAVLHINNSNNFIKFLIFLDILIYYVKNNFLKIKNILF
jgi:hypothetical protein